MGERDADPRVKDLERLTVQDLLALANDLLDSTDQSDREFLGLIRQVLTKKSTTRQRMA